ncbi:transcriptional regulator [Stigmatella sp. ncwal1]|uniref:Transcriptional regulator n=1 Tax=Stigmatella ashevillensis TaxID=2995309 RepID=A0ABT5D7E9_9BACT|nr:transcriptional regulator [Stigmatella ashevillena]MDC0708196.1 transcriptional regulator [Stigmatella ashevillena]
MCADPCAEAPSAREEACSRTARVLLLGADASLASLVSDVLGEVGITVMTEEANPQATGAVLVMVQRGDSILGALQRAREAAGTAPVFVLVPFADGRLVQLAIQLGAQGCFALGQPMEELLRMVRSGLSGAEEAP